MEVEGKIKHIDITREYGNNGFRKREVVVTTQEQYPQHLLIEFIQDKTNLLDAYKVGDDVKIGINLRGREWINPQGETRYFNSIQGWRIENLAQAQAQGGQQIPPAPPASAFPPADNIEDDFEDDLPF